MNTASVRTRILRGVSASALLLLASPAFAQSAPDTAPAPQDTPADVVVTGSRIARPQFETFQPTQVIGKN